MDAKRVPEEGPALDVRRVSGLRCATDELGDGLAVLRRHPEVVVSVARHDEFHAGLDQRWCPEFATMFRAVAVGSPRVVEPERDLAEEHLVRYIAKPFFLHDALEPLGLVPLHLLERTHPAEV